MNQKKKQAEPPPTSRMHSHSRTHGPCVKSKNGQGRYTHTFELDYLNWEVLLPHTEDLEITKDRLFGLRVAVDLDAQEVALVLPIKLALHRTNNERGHARATTQHAPPTR